MYFCSRGGGNNEKENGRTPAAKRNKKDTVDNDESERLSIISVHRLEKILAFIVEILFIMHQLTLAKQAWTYFSFFFGFTLGSALLG